MTSPIPYFIFSEIVKKEIPEDIKGVIWEYYKEIPCKKNCPCYNCWAGCWYYGYSLSKKDNTRP